MACASCSRREWDEGRASHKVSGVIAVAGKVVYVVESRKEVG